MKGYEGHSVVVAEQVVKADESHSVGVHTNETNLASCARGQANGIRLPSWHMGLAGESTRFIDLKQPFAVFFTYM